MKKGSVSRVSNSQSPPKLLIVESPGKLKTLRKILGPGWLLEASVGHTTELAHDGPKRWGFDLKEGRIETRYEPRGSRGKQVLSQLRAAVKRAGQIYLATDPDREGEAIAWHLVQQLRLKQFTRVSYTQITESAVQAAIRNPRPLDIPLIQAQRARQCLDKLVGYEVSPLLWDSTGGKSAGRVQSATLHLICKRERERLAFKPEDYWTLQSIYFDGLSARYEPAAQPASSAEQEEEAGRVKSQAEADRIAQIARSAVHRVLRIRSREENRTPPPPFITSSLQQAAGMRFRHSPQKTMQIAQELYEGIGGKGLITYMRTDAVALSPEFIAEAREWLQKNAPEALAKQAPSFKSRADAQAAHEAIRPTSVDLTPEKAQALLNREQLGVYTLIWERAIASQCCPAKLARTEIEIRAESTRWIARGMRVMAPGYLRFWRNIQEERELPLLQEGQALRLQEVKTEKRTTEPPSRYSEPKVIQLMEKLGIGRPSTYASTILTLKEREYVFLEKSLLAPTPLGLATDEALKKAMPELVDAAFTAQMEASLDQIAGGELDWECFLCGWHESYLVPALIQARALLVGVPRVSVGSQTPRGAQGKPIPGRKTPRRRFRPKKPSRHPSV
jgi:DNA topoisomerase I